MKRILVVFVSVVAFCHGTILDTLKARHETTLLSLLQTAGLDSALAGDGMTFVTIQRKKNKIYV